MSRSILLFFILISIKLRWFFELRIAGRICVKSFSESVILWISTYLKTLISRVSSRSFPYHGHSDEIQRKFFRIEGDGLFQGQQGLLDWVSLVSLGGLSNSSDSLTINFRWNQFWWILCQRLWNHLNIYQKS